MRVVHQRLFRDLTLERGGGSVKTVIPHLSCYKFPFPSKTVQGHCNVSWVGEGTNSFFLVCFIKVNSFLFVISMLPYFGFNAEFCM